MVSISERERERDWVVGGNQSLAILLTAWRWMGRVNHMVGFRARPVILSQQYLT